MAKGKLKVKNFKEYEKKVKEVREEMVWVDISEFRRKGFIGVAVPNWFGEVFPVSVKIGKREWDKRIIGKMLKLAEAFANASLFMEAEANRQIGKYEKKIGKGVKEFEANKQKMEELDKQLEEIQEQKHEEKKDSD